MKKHEFVFLIFAVRPLPQECHIEDKEMLSKEDDNIDELKKRCLEVRKEVNTKLPPHELALDDLLVVKDSTINNAGNGLFYEPELEPSEKTHTKMNSGTTICYYTGHRHNFLSQKFISDKSYLLNVADGILVDPGPLLSIKARYINDPLNERLVNCKFVPEPDKFRCAVVATRDIIPGEELFVSYGEMYWSQQSFDGTILKH
jgi:hypothetical protein